jgi:hypothetical protein
MIDFKLLFENHPLPFMTRTQLSKIIGGIVSRKTLANLDAQRQGIKGKQRISHKTVAYPVTEVISFFENRAKAYSKQNDNEAANG